MVVDGLMFDEQFVVYCDFGVLMLNWFLMIDFNDFNLGFVQGIVDDELGIMSVKVNGMIVVLQFFFSGGLFFNYSFSLVEGMNQIIVEVVDQCQNVMMQYDQFDVLGNFGLMVYFVLVQMFEEQVVLI